MQVLEVIEEVQSQVDLPSQVIGEGLVAMAEEEEKKSEEPPPMPSCCEIGSALASQKENLLAFAKGHLDACDTYDVALTSKKVIGLEVRQFKDPAVGGSMVTITKAKIDGLTIDKYKAFKAEIKSHTPVLDTKLTMDVLEDHEGHMVTHTRVNMPFPLTNRSIFNIYHLYDQADGSYVDLCSYQGTDDIAASAAGKKVAGKNVIATNHIDYRHMEPYDGGCNWTSVLCTNVGGSLPVYLQN